MKAILKPRILILNGSIRGAKGNCGRLIAEIETQYGRAFDLQVSHLASATNAATKKKLHRAEALLAITGTYWESWGSPMQRFFEDFTDFETTDLFMNKPCGAIVLSHSTGGKSVLSRLQGTFNLFGCAIPPLAGIELSHVAQAALAGGKMKRAAADVWNQSDIATIFENIRSTLCGEKSKAWPVDTKDFRRIWLKSGPRQ